jgi:hypothetical protein
MPHPIVAKALVTSDPSQLTYICYQLKGRDPFLPGRRTFLFGTHFL